MLQWGFRPAPASQSDAGVLAGRRPLPTDGCSGPGSFHLLAHSSTRVSELPASRRWKGNERTENPTCSHNPWVSAIPGLRGARSAGKCSPIWAAASPRQPTLPQPHRASLCPVQRGSWCLGLLFCRLPLLALFSSLFQKLLPIFPLEQCCPGLRDSHLGSCPLPLLWLWVQF